MATFTTRRCCWPGRYGLRTIPGRRPPVRQPRPTRKRKATEHGVAAISQDARESLDYSVRTYYAKASITYLQRTTTLPDGARVRGSHCVTTGEAGEIRITFYPAAVDLCYEEFEQLRDAIPLEAEKPPERACDATRAELVVLPVESGRRGRRWQLRPQWPRRAAACRDRHRGS